MGTLILQRDSAQLTCAPASWQIGLLAPAAVNIVLRLEVWHEAKDGQ